MAAFQTVHRAKREPFLTAPNLVSLSRIPMGALVWLRPLDPFYVLGLMALAAVSDIFDGWLERYLRARRGQPSRSGHTIGMWLDPLCDKIFILCVLAAVIDARRPALFMLPLIASREIIQTAAALGWEFIPSLREHLALRFQASLIGKAATTGQFCTIGAVLMGYPTQVPLAFLTGALGLAAGLSYIARSWRRSCAS